MTILITGVAGFIGSHLASKMLSQNFNVLGIDNLNNYYSVNLKKYRLKVFHAERISNYGGSIRVYVTSLDNKNIKINKMDKNIPDETIPIQSEDLHYQVARIYGDLGEKESMKNIMDKLISRKNSRPSNRVEYANSIYKELDDPTTAIDILEKMMIQFLQLEGMVKAQAFGRNTITKSEWNRWQKSYPEIVSSLVYMYRKTNRLMDAEIVLSDWVDRNPSDKNAKKILNEIRSDG